MKMAFRMALAVVLFAGCTGLARAGTNTNMSATVYQTTSVATIQQEIAAASGMSVTKARVLVPDREVAVAIGNIMAGTGTASQYYRDVMGGQWANKTTAQVISDMTALHNLADTYTPRIAIDTQNAASRYMLNNVDAVVTSIENVYSSVGSLDAHASLAVDQGLANRIWAGGFGQWQDQKERKGYSGYEYKTKGVALGYDRLFGNMLVGGSFAYSAGSLDLDDLIGDDHDLDAYSFNLYAKYFHHSGFENTLLGGYSYLKNNADRRIAGTKTSHKYNTDVWSIGDIVGFRFNLSDAISLTPSVGLVYTHAKSDNYVVRGGPGTRVKTDAGKSLVMPLNLELGFNKCIDEVSSISFTANAGWRHDFKGNDSLRVTNYVNMGGGAVQSYSLRGMAPGKNVYNLGAGIKYNTRNFEFYAKYDFDMKSKYRSHQVTGGIGIKF